jgi:capsular exopolysaccharide synthesis family protein
MNLQPTDIENELIEESSFSKLSEYLEVCRHRFWLIVALGLLTSTIAFIWAYNQTRIYEATVTLLIEPQVPKILTTEVEKNYAENLSPGLIQTHVEVLKSYPVLEETVRRLVAMEQLELHPNGTPMRQLLRKLEPRWIKDLRYRFQNIANDLMAYFYSLFQALLGEKPDERDPRGQEQENENAWLGEIKGEFPDPDERDLVEGLGASVRIEVVPRTKLIQITGKSVDPIFAARAANMLATVYIDRTLRNHSKATETASRWFENNLDDLRRKVEESESTLYAYRSKYGIMNLGKQMSIAEQKLQQLNSNLVGAETERTNTQTEYQLIQELIGSAKRQELTTIDLDAFSEVFKSASLRELQRRENQLVLDLATLSEKYGPLHPAMLRAQIEWKELKNQIVEEVQNVYQGIEKKFQLASAREKAARKKFEEQKKIKLLLDKHAVKASLLEREAESNRQLYGLFLKQMRETNISTEIERKGNIYLSEPAMPNFTPVKPKPKQAIFIGLLAGLALGVGIAFLLELSDQTLKGPEDIERFFPGLAFLGWVPQVGKNFKKRMERIVDINPSNPISERYRFIRTSILLAASKQSTITLIVTSTGEGEGKTTLATNLAISLAKLENNKVILIDGDMRKPRMENIFSLKDEGEKSKGLMQYLMGKAERSEILHATDIPNLAVIPAGGTPTNPIDLLLSKRMEELLEWCKQQNYHVILDAPPVLVVADAMALAPRFDAGTVFVVSSGETSRCAAKEAIQCLLENRLKIVGIVIQKLPRRKIPLYYGNQRNPPQI